MTHRYIGTKEVLAWSAEKDGKPGYGVKYADGYTSWSPKEAFEEAYRTSEPGMAQALTFGDALHYLKLGKRVARAGWNGNGQWVTMAGPKEGTKVHSDAFWSANNAEFARDQPDSEVTVTPYFTIKNAQDEIAVWVPSTSDCLANDWRVLA